MGTVRVIRNVREMHRIADRMRREGLRIGLVPTMGSLHAGHSSLIRLAGRASDRTVVSVFVNPSQFGPHEDFETYPRDFERDRAMVRDCRAAVIVIPERVYGSGVGA